MSSGLPDTSGLDQKKLLNVKVLKLHEHGANKSFITECEAPKNIHHQNLVKIITSCSSIDFRGNDFKALVYKFMENGSLESWLHTSLLEQQEPKNLNFVQKLNIAIDVASALDFFFFFLINCIGLSSSSFLAKIFSATIGISNHQQSSSIGIRGTISHVALEQVMKIVDPQIIMEMEKEPSRSRQSSTTNISKLEACLVPIFQIGVSCSAEMLSERMSVKDVLKELHKIRNVFIGVRGQRHQDGRRNDS
ncbi:unnamed protein product [Camellia sinensis]